MNRTIVALVAAFGVAACGPAWAAWPDDKPVEVVVGFAPGGGTDVMARKLLPFVERALGGKAKFVVLNKPGAGGEIAFASIARAAPDGYAIGVVNVPGYNFLPMTRKTQYATNDIRLVARAVEDPNVVVVPADSGFNTLPDVIAALRARPGSVTFGHNGAGTNGHLAIRMLAAAAKVEPNEISYRGTAAQRTDLLGGHLQVGMISLSEIPELHGSNKGPLRVIAILSKKRFAALPEVPTAEEAGFAVISTAERGFAVAKGVPDDIVSKLETAIAEGLRSPDFLKSSPGDEPVISFLPGAEWQRHLDAMSEALRPYAESMRADEQK
ncbi:tripartite tricarboxylate transporter substrate binding protein [Bradyrhizobium diazoefficiens]|nr:tripartite tricarboxylate transporter substrate binding protein [Bradyrhizobium diazoefficiens]UCF51765.1 MAG: tripartite tricarboxylate transporter substrate binding protein [Bradyrhizobium sp.]MBR0967707.1 tripartite tricarboxylate transporter substrate binding protein [Bradyrhizobium diazoefficiens]MBR0981101.1 tripartite tricarboxylate transporter substrate binding protein [Bradyrhizobium diazoefficiens]MBR1010578.1 tripartite tricarboxylate transporter substrate binding protein [Bradyrh